MTSNPPPSSTAAPAGATQAIAFALAVAVHGIALAIAAGRALGGSAMPLGQKTAIGLFLLFLLAAEGLVLLLANRALERVAGRWGAWLDPLKALAVTFLTVLAAASLVKYDVVGIHLKSTDFWFVANSAAQVAQESQPTERAAAAKLGLGALALFAAVWGLLDWERRRGRRPIPSSRLAALFLLTALGAVACYRIYPAVAGFAQRVVPEVHWANARFAPDPFRHRAPPGSESTPDAGPPIEAYPVDRSSGNRYNVVLIMLESVPWSRAPWEGDRAHIMPNLAALAEESTVFDRAYTTSTHSDYAQMAILSSLFPRKYDVHDYYTKLDYPRTLLWDVLKPAGYATTVFSGQNERWGNMIEYLNTPGLDLLRHSPSWPDARKKGSGTESKVYAETPVTEWRLWRERGEEPYFTYFNFQSNHFTYQIPPEAERPFEPHEIDFEASFVRYPRDKVDVMSNRFDNALRYADRWIGEVVETLRQRGEWERTILVVVSDHGEAFYEHGMPTHGTALFEEQVRSLWLLRIPGGSARTVTSPVSLLDLAPTLLTALELPPHGNFQGRGDVLDPGYDGAERMLPFTIQGLTREDGLLFDDWKLTINWDRRARSLYHLAEDPLESENVADRYPGQADRLQGMLLGFLDRQLAYYAEEGWREGRYVAPID